MTRKNLKSYKINMKYYFLGIGGVSMSALAIMLFENGERVEGYDERQSHATDLLEGVGIKVWFDFKKNSIEKSDVIVYSSAFKDGNDIFDFAKSINKKMMCRGELLGKISSHYSNTIAVSGAHGKTTVTAMIYEVLKVAGKNPTLHLGGFRCDDNKNFALGEKDFFVTEACEYCDNFLYLHPHLAVVTNVEPEHLDYFKTFENEKRSFERFKNQSQIVVDDVSEYSAKRLRHNRNGVLSFDMYRNDQKLFHLNLKICEEINAQNCMFVHKTCQSLGVRDCLIKLGLENYRGVKTRFEKVKCERFENVICDYAHHPTEISKAIKSAKKIYKDKKLIVIFQPHTYSRTKNLLPKFIRVFKDEFCPIIYQTYSAREKPTDGISASQFVRILKKYNKNAIFSENFDNLMQILENFDKNDVVLLFVGAGDLPMILHKNNFIS